MEKLPAYAKLILAMLALGVPLIAYIVDTRNIAEAANQCCASHPHENVIRLDQQMEYVIKGIDEIKQELKEQKNAIR